MGTFQILGSEFMGVVVWGWGVRGFGSFGGLGASGVGGFVFVLGFVCLRFEVEGWWV